MIYEVFAQVDGSLTPFVSVLKTHDNAYAEETLRQMKEEAGVRARIDTRKEKK